MESNFWQQLESYKRSRTLSNCKEFEQNYFQVHTVVYKKMMGPDVISNGDSIFTCYVGADDGHEDLVDFIIWNGKHTVENFLNNPSTALSLAKNMSKDSGFDGDVNILKSLIYKF